MMDPTRDADGALRSWSPSGASSAQAVVVFAAELPVFAGHFPDRPVVPGVHQLAVVVALCRRALARSDLQLVDILHAKWTLPLMPGDQLVARIDWAIHPDHIAIDGRILRDDVVACVCRLRLR